MKLAEYLRENEETQAAFAKRSGVAQVVISRICNDGDARGRNWALISQATDGQVTAEDHFKTKSGAAA